MTNETMITVKCDPKGDNTLKQVEVRFFDNHVEVNSKHTRSAMDDKPCAFCDVMTVDEFERRLIVPD